jgi:hypothetical protein
VAPLVVTFSPLDCHFGAITVSGAVMGALPRNWFPGFIFIERQRKQTRGHWNLGWQKIWMEMAAGDHESRLKKLKRFWCRPRQDKVVAEIKPRFSVKFWKLTSG